jgi:hypothetical protein
MVINPFWYGNMYFAVRFAKIDETWLIYYSYFPLNLNYLLFSSKKQKYDFRHINMYGITRRIMCKMPVISFWF